MSKYIEAYIGMKKRVLSFLLALTLLWTLSLPALAAVEDTGFSDVTPGAWYAQAVAYVRDHGLMSGTTATTFFPNTTTTRAMLVTILYRRAGRPTAQPARFFDVAAEVWYGSAAGWAAANGIVSGYSGGRFAPDDPVTREQLATILWRVAGSPTPVGKPAFSDQPAIASFAVSAVAWAQEQGIVSGIPQGALTSANGRIHLEDGNRFEPQGSVTRAELAVMLHRWLSSAIPDTSDASETSAATPSLTIQVGSSTFTVTLEDNDTTRAFVARLPMTVHMGELNGNEKYYYLTSGLPTNSQRPGTLHTGDLMLYGPDCLVLFYETFSSEYSYTRMGRADDPTGLAAALGRGGVEVRFQANETDEEYAVV